MDKICLVEIHGRGFSSFLRSVTFWLGQRNSNSHRKIRKNILQLEKIHEKSDGIFMPELLSAKTETRLDFYRRKCSILAMHYFIVVHLIYLRKDEDQRLASWLTFDDGLYENQKQIFLLFDVEKRKFAIFCVKSEISSSRTVRRFSMRNRKIVRMIENFIQNNVGGKKMK